MEIVKKGIDVSEWDGAILWNKVKTDFTIIRLGFGTCDETHRDKFFLANVRGCIENKIPFGVYIYSYAKTPKQLLSEIVHAKTRLAGINGKPFAVFIDMEDKSTKEVGKSTLTEYAVEFCKQLKDAGYRAGVYANENWFKNHLDVAKIANAGNVIWCAKYSTKMPEIDAKCDIWQYTSDGEMTGFPVDRVDLNYMYTDLLSS